jgi:hypothetical protein
MAQYLLGSQCFLDIAKTANLSPERWLAKAGERGIDGGDIYISAATPMILSATLARETASPGLTVLRENIEILVRRYVGGLQVVSVTKEIADRWGTLLDLELNYKSRLGTIGSYRFHEKLVLATAIEGLNGRPFVLVERNQAAHDALRPFGLKVEDPYQLYP